MGKKKKKPVEGEEEEVPAEGEEDGPPIGYVSNILEDQKLFALAGVSFGEQDAHRI